jgi:hypothetical protein
MVYSDKILLPIFLSQLHECSVFVQWSIHPPLDLPVLCILSSLKHVLLIADRGMAGLQHCQLDRLQIPQL